MFKFELSSVLSLKEKIEDTKKRELGIATKKKEELEQEKSNLIGQKHALHDEIKRSSAKEVDINAVKSLNCYTSYINKQIIQTEGHIVKVQKVVDKKREELLEAMKERKILDNLKELKLEQYTQEARKIEQILVDEVVSYKYGEARRSEE